MIKYCFLIIFGISTFSAVASQKVDISILPQQEILSALDVGLESDATQVKPPKFKKLKAVLLALFLGHFGVHRIYLGTAADVPVVYSLTLGGGLGLLPLLDMVAILTTKNLEQYSNNEQVFMWSK